MRLEGDRVHGEFRFFHTPHSIQYLHLRLRVSLIPREKLENSIGFRREMDTRLSFSDNLFSWLKRIFSEWDRFFDHFFFPPGQCYDACFHFSHITGFTHIVIRSEIEHRDLIFYECIRSEYEYGSSNALRSNGLNKSFSVHDRKIHVEDNNIIMTMEHRQRLLTMHRSFCGMSFQTKVFDEISSQMRMIFYNEYFHTRRKRSKYFRILRKWFK